MGIKINSKLFRRNLLKKIFLVKMNRKYYKKFIIYEKSSAIPSTFNKLFLKIHKGKVFRNLNINRFFIGRVIGSFLITRKPNVFIKKIKTKGKKNIIFR